MVCLRAILSTAVKLLAESEDELALGPVRRLSLRRRRKQSLFTPTILLDFLGRTALAAVAGRGPLIASFRQ